MTENRIFLPDRKGWWGIVLPAIIATLLLLLLSIGVGLAAPEEGVVLESLVADNRLVIDGAVLDSAVSTGYTTTRNEVILGYERDLFLLNNGLLLEWDGDEGDPTSLDHTGLGGYDLTAGGFMDRLALEVTAISQPAEATFSVYSNEGNWSSYSLDIHTTGQVVIPISAFETTGGSGADFADVGSLALRIDGSTAGLSLGSLEMQSSLTAERQIALVVDQNGNGLFDPNDVVEHTITVNNGGSSASAPLRIVESIIGHTYGLVNGSVTADGGQVLSGNGAGQQIVKVLFDPLAAGQTADMGYRVTMLNGGTVSVTLVVQDGDTPPGSNGDPVSTLNSPFTNGNGDVGFSGSLTTGAGTDNFIWFDSGIVWRNSDALPDVLTGAESTMGISNGGGFNYSPSTNGDDSVWTQNGLLLTEGPAPDFPPPTSDTFNSRPTMTSGGAAYWVAGFDESGGTTTDGRMLYTSSNAMSNTITVVIRSDDVISGFVVDRPSGVDFDYQISENNNHHVQSLLMDTGSTTNDGFMYVDGTLLARETTPTGDGDNWDNHDSVSINDSGNYIFSGDTDGVTTSDEFIAYNGSIAIREGDMIGGVTLTSTAFVNALSINNSGAAVYIWAVSGGTEILFASCDITDIANTTTALLFTDDMVDVDGNGTADAAVTDFNASGVIGPGLDLAEDGLVYIEVDLDYGQGDLEAIIGLQTGCGGVGGGPIIEVNPLGMVSIQPTDTQMTQTLTISNTGDADLLWTIDEVPPVVNPATGNKSITVDTSWGQVDLVVEGLCVQPTNGDIPWVGANPTAGTTPAGTADNVAVGFDSTGIDLGVFRGDLCVTNNSITPTIQVPVVLEVPPAPSLVLTKTVGTDPNSCATTNSITIPAGQGGTQVTYCYTVQNTGNITLSVQNLVDDQLGVLLGPDAPFDVAPGASDFYTVTTTITQTTVNSATWTAASSSGAYLDPTGDTIGMGAVQHDITDFNATTEAGVLTLQMAFDGAISPPGTGNPDDIVGFIEIDRDGSTLTGFPSLSQIFCPATPTIGTDYFLDIGSYNSGAGTINLLVIDEFNNLVFPIGAVNITFGSDFFTINVPLSLMDFYGPEEGIVDVVTVIGTVSEPTDCAPNADVLTSRLEVSGSDTATVTQDAPTGVALSGVEGSTPVAWLPVWLIVLALVVMVAPVALLRFSGKRLGN